MPLGLAFIAGALRDAGHRVQVIDAIAIAPDQYVRYDGDILAHGLSAVQLGQLVQPDTKVIGISMMFSGNWPLYRELADYLGDLFPSATLIAGGEHVTAIPDLCLKQTRRLSVIVMGEGEETVVELVQVIGLGLPMSSVAGIAFRNDEGQCEKTMARKRIQELDSAPWPAWDLLPMDDYIRNRTTFGIEHNTVSMPLLATRGCPYRCTFCSSPQMWGTRYYMRRPSDVADEIEKYIATYGIMNFDFHDLTAIIKKEWIMEFTAEITSRTLDITWQIPGGTRSEAIDKEVAQALYRSGCRNITYAPESGSVEMLRLIKKRVSLPSMLRSMRYSATERMNIKLNIILAFPDEKHSHIWMTVLFLIKASWHGAHDMSPGFFSPYPGSELFDRLVQEGKLDYSSDAYFKEIVSVDSISGATMYNAHISPWALRAYQLLYFIAFYGSNYLFRPWRLLRTLHNLTMRKAESRAEMTIIELMGRRDVTVLEQALPMEETPLANCLQRKDNLRCTGR